MNRVRRHGAAGACRRRVVRHPSVADRAPGARVLVDLELKDVRSRVVAHDVEVELGAGDLAQVEIGIHDTLPVHERTGHQVTEWTVDRGASGAEHIRPILEVREDFEVVGIVTLGDELVAADHEAAALEGDVAQGGLPAVAGVGRRRQINLDALAVHRHAGEGHVVLPADQSAHATERRVDDGQRAPVPLAPDETLGRRRFQLAVRTRQHPLRGEIEQGAEQRAAAVGRVPLDYPHREEDAGIGGRRGHAVRFRPGDGNRGVPVAAERPPARGRAPAHRGAEGESPRVSAHERLGKDDQAGLLARDDLGHGTDVVNGGGGIEGEAARLHGGDPDLGCESHAAITWRREAGRRQPPSQRPTATLWQYRRLSVVSGGDSSVRGRVVVHRAVPPGWRPNGPWSIPLTPRAGRTAR